MTVNEESAQVIEALSAWIESQQIETGVAATALMGAFGAFLGQQAKTSAHLIQLVDIGCNGIRSAAITAYCTRNQTK